MIRLAKDTDLKNILAIYQTARQYMADNGNASQWGNTYPPAELLEDDIQKKDLYVFTQDEEVHGVFAFILGDDSTYAHIENGAWKNDKPYGTIHRIASDGAVKGVFNQCVEYCKRRIDNLRIDTHADNKTMQYLVEKNGFERCGIIYTDIDGSPRIAYQFVGKKI